MRAAVVAAVAAAALTGCFYYATPPLQVHQTWPLPEAAWADTTYRASAEKPANLSIWYDHYDASGGRIWRIYVDGRFTAYMGRNGQRVDLALSDGAHNIKVAFGPEEADRQRIESKGFVGPTVTVYIPGPTSRIRIRFGDEGRTDYLPWVIVE